MYRSTWCEIDLAQFRKNLACLRSIAATKALLVVKANAYGHGLVPMALAAEKAGIDMLGVATIGEAEALLAAGVSTPILIMCAIDSRELEFCAAHGVHFMASRAEQVRNAHAVAEKNGRQPLVHVEIDIAMSRSGVYTRDLPGMLEDIPAGMRKNIVGICGHFSSADLADLDLSERQFADFQQACAVMQKAGLSPLRHAANSPATLRLEHARLDMVRLGVAAYGLEPAPDAPLPSGVLPILSWKAKATNVKTISPGRGIGYAWLHVAKREENVFTFAAGYADGYHRVPKGVNTVLAHGRETPVLGSVCMDQCVARVPEGAAVALEDEIVLLGRQGQAEISADTLAERWGTNNYDVVAGIRGRVPRVYVGGDSS